MHGVNVLEDRFQRTIFREVDVREAGVNVQGLVVLTPLLICSVENLPELGIMLILYSSKIFPHCKTDTDCEQSPSWSVDW